MSQRTILMMAGGTGGHIFPALAIASLLKKQGWRIVWLGAVGAMETHLVPVHEPTICLETIKVTGVRGKGIVKLLIQPWIQGKALCKIIAIIFRYRPDIVIGFGGFTSFAGGIAAKLLWRPLIIHEQNARVGLVNRLLATIANQVLFAFPSAFRGKKGLVGNPIRQELLNLPNPDERFAGRQGPIQLVVLGGSLGAAILNQIVPNALALIDSPYRPHVLHQTGWPHIEQVKATYQEVGVTAECLPFIDNIASVLQRADLVICRAGALTISELAAAGVAAIMVPFAAAADDHQTYNARYLSEADAGILLKQTELTPERLAQTIIGLSREQLLVMAQRAKSLAKPNAANDIIEVINRLAIA